MGLDRIIEEVGRRGKAESEENLRKARSEAESILAKAQSEAKSHLDEVRSHATEAAERERVEEISKAKSVGKRMLAEARKDVVDRHLEAVWARILEARETEAYGRLVSSLANEAVKELGTGCRVYARGQDARFLGAIKAAGPIESAGGVIAEDSTGRVRIDGRLEALFNDRRERLAAMIYGDLFK